RELGLDEDVRYCDVGTRARERQRVRAAEPARPAGDERDATGQVDLESHAETLVAPRKEDLPGEDETLDLRGAFVDLEELRVAHELFDRVLLDVPVSAE